MSEARPLLEVRDLTVSLQSSGLTTASNEVLRGVNFHLEAGRSLAVLGATGSGKTLLCRSITRFFHRLPIREVKGEVIFEKRNLLETGQARLFQIRGTEIAYVLQGAHSQFHPRLSIAQHFDLLLKHERRSLQDRTGHAMKYLYQVGIVDPDALLLDRIYPSELDDLTRQKIMIASALACEPKILIADEWTAEFDSGAVARLTSVIERLKKERGLSLLLVTGRVRRAEQFGDEVAVLDQGRIVESAAPRKLFAEAREEATQSFLDGTLLAGRPKERLLDSRKRGAGPSPDQG